MLAALALLFAFPALLAAEPVAVRVVERPSKASLVLSSRDGSVLANGEQSQTVTAGRVTSRVVFQFVDGSLHDETTVFSQDEVLRLLSYHLVQKGPAFRWTLDMTMNTETGRVVVRHRDRGEEEEVDDETLALSPDVANGMMISVLKNLSPATVPARASFVAAIPGPRPVRLGISTAGSEIFPVAGAGRRATHYVIKAEIGGLPGLIAPLIGRQPPDTHVWILEGSPPAFARSEGPLFYGGPTWRIEIADHRPPGPRP